MPLRKRNKKLGPFKQKPEDLVAAAKGASKSFSSTQNEYNRHLLGYREKLYESAAECYRIAHAFSRDLPSFERFMSDASWENVRQRPKDGETIKAVLIFVMRPTSKSLQNRVIKTAKVLQTFFEEEVDPLEVAARLKSEGGIEALYRRSTGKGHGALLEDSDMFGSGNNEEEPLDEERGDSGEDSGAEPDNVSRKTAQRSATRQSSDNGWPGEEQSAPAPHRTARFDPRNHLAVWVGERDLTEILSKPQHIVIEADVGAKNETGWRTVTAVSVRVED